MAEVQYRLDLVPYSYHQRNRRLKIRFLVRTGRSWLLKSGHLPEWEYLTELKISFLPSPTPRIRLHVRLAFSIRYFESSRDFFSFQRNYHMVRFVRPSSWGSSNENHPNVTSDLTLDFILRAVLIVLENIAEQVSERDSFSGLFSKSIIGVCCTDFGDGHAFVIHTFSTI